LEISQVNIPKEIQGEEFICKRKKGHAKEA
jgi:hypothetical protein